MRRIFPPIGAVTNLNMEAFLKGGFKGTKGSKKSREGGQEKRILPWVEK
jgi:hypothetical protein